MTKRLMYPFYWAEGGTATDPDLDTTAPSYEPNRYEEFGWHAEKPPEDWQNFLSQITDLKVINTIIAGIPYFDASVAYQDGAVYTKGGLYYVLEGGVESEILDLNQEIYVSLVAAAKQLYDDHMAADNPHQVTMDKLVGGGYEKGFVDDALGSPTNPKTIVYHKNRKGASVHFETAESVGTLPAATGGVFTGAVVFLDTAIAQMNPDKYIHLNKATALVEITNGTYAIGVDSQGNGYIVGTDGKALLMSELNMEFLVKKYNFLFALPVPIFSMNIENALSDGDSVGNWTITTVDEPEFSWGKGLDITTNATIVSGGSFTGAHTVFVRGFDAGAELSAVADVTDSASYPNLPEFVIAVNQGFSHIKQVIVYPLLTAYQKTMLVNQ